jgi:hypothetical protein
MVGQLLFPDLLRFYYHLVFDNIGNESIVAVIVIDCHLAGRSKEPGVGATIQGLNIF